VLGFTFLATLLTSIAAGLIPALQASRIDLNESLKGGAHSGPSFIRSRTRRVSPALLISELALTLAVLIRAGLLIKSFLVLRAVDLGYNPKNLLTMFIQPDVPRGSEQLKNFNRELLTRINALPGVQGAVTSNSLPMVDSGIRPRFKLTIVGRPPEPESHRPPVESFDASAEYFRLMGMQLRAGRGFTEQEDRNAYSIIVNERLVRHYFAGEDPIGKRIQRSGDEEPVLTIVGVVADVKRYGIEAESLPEIYSYLPAPQFPHFYLAVHTVGHPLKLAPAVRQQVREIDANPSTAIDLVTTME
jgi:putative ABC transport system permease protein